MLTVIFSSGVGIETSHCSRVSKIGELFWLYDGDGIPFKPINFESLLSVKISNN